MINANPIQGLTHACQAGRTRRSVLKTMRNGSPRHFTESKPGSDFGILDLFCGTGGLHQMGGASSQTHVVHNPKVFNLYRRAANKEAVGTKVYKASIHVTVEDDEEFTTPMTDAIGDYCADAIVIKGVSIDWHTLEVAAGVGVP